MWGNLWYVSYFLTFVLVFRLAHAAAQLTGLAGTSTAGRNAWPTSWGLVAGFVFVVRSTGTVPLLDQTVDPAEPRDRYGVNDATTPRTGRTSHRTPSPPPVTGKA